MLLLPFTGKERLRALVLRHLGVHFVRPRRNASGKIQHILKPCLLEELDCFGAASTHLAVGHDLAAGIEFTDALGQVVDGDQVSAQVADLVFVRFAHVENKNVFSSIEPALELFRLDLGVKGLKILPEKNK